MEKYNRCALQLLLCLTSQAVLQHCLARNNGAGFKPCMNKGRQGPTQAQCAAAHETMGTGKVEVISTGALAGIQIWTVPETTIYSVTALGAGGGAGLFNFQHSPGHYANAEFNLTQGEKLYILVGQPGQSACDKVQDNTSYVHVVCRTGDYSMFEDGNQTMVGGGGGGGGGSFVFKRDNTTGELMPLVISGGGGGNGRGNSYKTLGTNIPGIHDGGPGVSAVTPASGPGGGGGWSGRQTTSRGGMSLLEGATGGAACNLDQRIKWPADGGFGGGGGGCTAGGGGGGYTGGNVSLTDDPLQNGQDGTSYINPHGMKPQHFPRANMVQREGEVDIARTVACRCEFICIYSDVKNNHFTCYCPPNSVLAPDGISCITRVANNSTCISQSTTSPSSKVQQPISPVAIAGYFIGGTVVGVLIVIIIVAIIYLRQK